MPLSLGMNRMAYNTILTIVDHYIKLAKYYPILKTITVKQLKDLVVCFVVYSFRLSSSIVSNQGSPLISIF